MAHLRIKVVNHETSPVDLEKVILDQFKGHDPINIQVLVSRLKEGGIHFDSEEISVAIENLIVSKQLKIQVLIDNYEGSHSLELKKNRRL